MKPTVDVMLDEGVPQKPLRCHEKLHLVCGTCLTYPKSWHGEGWHCRTRGDTVSAHTHACVRYREDAAVLDELYPSRVEWRRQDVERMELPLGRDWYWRRRDMANARQAKEDLRTRQGGVVYFIDCNGYTKIGHTFETIANRMKGIETHNPFPLQLWALVAGPVLLERKFHSKFARRRHRCEWFRFKPEDRQTAERLVLLLRGEVYSSEGRTHA